MTKCNAAEMHRLQQKFTPVHVFCRQVQKSNHDAAPKLGIELGLIIDDMHKAFCEVELHMEVRELGGNTAPQALHQKQTEVTGWTSHSVHYQPLPVNSTLLLAPVSDRRSAVCK